MSQQKQQYTLEELTEMEELTRKIAKNVRFINENSDVVDEDLLTMTDKIAANLTVIDADENDLEDLLEKTGKIVANLQTISDAELDG